MANTKLKIKVGDTVKVIAGDDKNKPSAKVLKVLKETNRVVVEGINIVSKHVKPSASNPNGGIQKVEAPIHISNVMLVDAKGQATRVGRKLNSENKLQRFSKKSGDLI